VIHQDPVLSQVKLIAEPWDVGPGGYQVGNFPAGWAEWNGRYRDAVRDFWRGEPGMVGELASRLSGSSDLFGSRDRRPHASVNFVTSHDGFTLEDLVSYETKHNAANGEDNRDGESHNRSRNWGVEGPTTSLPTVRMRERMKRNFLATLGFSQGVPMLSHGDELGRTQRGNNNAYCQDNELTWVDWDLDARDRKLLEFAGQVLEIRGANPVFRRRTFFRGPRHAQGSRSDLLWLRPDGEEMTESDWNDPRSHVLAMLLYGHATDQTDERGRLIHGQTLLLLLNGGPRSRYFRLPAVAQGGAWRELVNSGRPGTRTLKAAGVNLAAHSLILLAHGGP
jgi:glycogen operon protein